METLSGKLVGFKSDFDKESKVLAEMVKALAEIQKKEKGKLDQLGKNLDAEMDKLRDTLEEQNNHGDGEKDNNFQERAGQDSLLLVKRVEQLELVNYLIYSNFVRFMTQKIKFRNSLPIFKDALGYNL